MESRVAIDSHHHLWRLTGSNYGWIEQHIEAPFMRDIARDFPPEEFAQVMRRHGVARSVLVQGDPTVADTDAMLAFARQNPFIAGVVGWIDLEAPDAAAEVRRRAGDPMFKGVRIWQLRHEDPAWILGGAQAAGLRATAEHGLCVDALLRPQHMASLCEALDRHPGLRVVVCHGAKPVVTAWTPGDASFRHWADGLRMLAARGCFIKLSGIVTESGPDWRTADIAPYVDTILEAFGPERTMWGSDWPVINRGGGYTRWLEAVETITGNLSPGQRASVFGGAASTFYRL